MSFITILLLSIFPFTIDSTVEYQQAPSTQANALSNTVLYIFTGSDWCADCKRLKKKVLSDADFIEVMEMNNIEIEIVDFPQRKEQSPELIKRNESIAETFDFQGIFPTLVLSQTDHEFETLSYKNQNASEFSTLILEKLKQLNE